ncbi:hypothetical protein L1987_25475 [Smallanthus sonchifolius]|uniref:Uncharacterized protein n=1 Tax=Smallanthus sonchifolius TaxID=185202 RepID=A0ACB9IMK7_9ASTR|nr:hypothetical protein L1987_25475 [Smallanthus sonchifolius]
MDSDLNRRRHNQQQNMINSGMYGEEDVFNPPVSSPNTEPILSRFMYQNLAQSHEIVRNNNAIVSSSSSVTVDRLMATNLLRQSSSPAGFFEHVNVENGYSMMRSMDEFRPANGSVPDSSFSSANRLKSPMAFSSGSHSSSRLQSHTKAGGYVASFPIGSWDESSMLTDGFMKELRETDQVSSCENQNEVEIHAPTGLTHQLSLPTSSSELSAMANLLQFQDNVPLRSRAKRGCATHPRSIAERVRRTRISERMRKLQDLVPNMDKQTSIADMLDLAVDYIKDLQKQVETHSDHHAKCTCPNKKKLT